MDLLSFSSGQDSGKLEKLDAEVRARSAELAAMLSAIKIDEAAAEPQVEALPVPDGEPSAEGRLDSAGLRDWETWYVVQAARVINHLSDNLKVVYLMGVPEGLEVPAVGEHYEGARKELPEAFKVISGNHLRLLARLTERTLRSIVETNSTNMRALPGTEFSLPRYELSRWEHFGACCCVALDVPSRLGGVIARVDPEVGATVVSLEVEKLFWGEWIRMVSAFAPTLANPISLHITKTAVEACASFDPVHPSLIKYNPDEHEMMNAAKTLCGLFKLFSPIIALSMLSPLESSEHKVSLFTVCASTFATETARFTSYLEYNSSRSVKMASAAISAAEAARRGWSKFLISIYERTGKRPLTSFPDRQSMEVKANLHDTENCMLDAVTTELISQVHMSIFPAFERAFYDEPNTEYLGSTRVSEGLGAWVSFILGIANDFEIWDWKERITAIAGFATVLEEGIVGIARRLVNVSVSRVRLLQWKVDAIAFLITSRFLLDRVAPVENASEKLKRVDANRVELLRKIVSGAESELDAVKRSLVLMTGDVADVVEWLKNPAQDKTQDPIPWSESTRNHFKIDYSHGVDIVSVVAALSGLPPKSQDFFKDLAAERVSVKGMLGARRAGDLNTLKTRPELGPWEYPPLDDNGRRDAMLLQDAINSQSSLSPSEKKASEGGF